MRLRIIPGRTAIAALAASSVVALLALLAGMTVAVVAGAAVVAGQFGAWTPIGTEQTATGYEVAWKVTGADQYGVWNTDSSGNYISNISGVVSGSDSMLETLETTFHQDLNGDGVADVLAGEANLE